MQNVPQMYNSRYNTIIIIIIIMITIITHIGAIVVHSNMYGKYEQFTVKQHNTHCPYTATAQVSSVHF